MQSVLIGFEHPVMDTLHFYFPQNSYCKAFRGVAECCAFSCFHDHVGPSGGPICKPGVKTGRTPQRTISGCGVRV